MEETIRERRTKRGVIKLKKPKVVRRKIKTAIGALIEDYKFVGGKPLGEQNPKWLQDDYVKFIRFAQHEDASTSNEGIVGIITNHSCLDNPTFRGMRQFLMSKTFDQIYVLDLHGSTETEGTIAATACAGRKRVRHPKRGSDCLVREKARSLARGVWYVRNLGQLGWKNIKLPLMPKFSEIE